MPKCPTCGTDSEYNYVGAIHVECVNYNCQHFNREAHEKWLEDERATPTPSAPDDVEYDYLYQQFRGMVVDPED